MKERDSLEFGEGREELTKEREKKLKKKGGLNKEGRTTDRLKSASPGIKRKKRRSTGKKRRRDVTGKKKKNMTNAREM